MSSDSSAGPSPVLGTPNVTDPALKRRLCVMMFLQYFVQGCYLPVIFVYLIDALGFTRLEVGTFSSALAVGPLLAPFIVGQLVDRHFSTERVLAICHSVAALLMFVMYWVSRQFGGEYDLFVPLVILGAVYATLYVPSMMLTNSVAFHHLKDSDREFPIMRMFGTIGFIVPAWLVEPLYLAGLEGPELNSARGIVLALAGVSGLVMAVYSLTLPHTPPSISDKKELAPGKVLRLLRNRNFLSLVLVSLLVAFVHQYHFNWNGPYLTAVLRQGGITGAWEQRISSIGQIFEIGVMVVLGFAVTRYGFKNTMLIGVTAYLLRCLIFAFAVSIDAPFPLVMTIVCIGQALHGLCFGCFLAAAFMYVDRVAPRDVRGSMQTFYGTFVLGLGFFAAGFVAGAVVDQFATLPEQTTLREQWGVESTAGMIATQPSPTEPETVYDWPGIWLSAAAIAAAALAAFAIAFPKQQPVREEESSRHSPSAVRERLTE